MGAFPGQPGGHQHDQVAKDMIAVRIGSDLKIASWPPPLTS